MQAPAAISLAQVIDRCVGRPLYLRQSSALALSQALTRRASGERDKPEGTTGSLRDLARATASRRADLGRRLGLPRSIAQQTVTVVETDEEEGARGGCSYTIVEAEQGKYLAIVPVVGALCKDHPGMWASFGPFTCYRDVVATLDAAVADSRVSAVLMIVDSTGGEAAGCFDAVDDLLEIRQAAAAMNKPIASFADGVAASAGYAMLCCATPGLCLASDGSEVGSIGAVQLVDEYVHHEGAWRKTHVIASGAFKAAHYPESPKDEATLAYLQQGINDCAAVFIDRVAQARSLAPKKIAELEAACVAGFRAVPLGLIDDTCTLREAMRRALDGVSTSSTAAPSDPGSHAGANAPGSHAKENRMTSFLKSLTQPFANSRRAEDAPSPDSPADDAPPPEDESGEEMTAERLREMYPDAVAEIEREAVEGSGDDEGEKPEDAPPEPSASAPGAEDAPPPGDGEDDEEPKPAPGADASASAANSANAGASGAATLAQLKALGIDDRDFLLDAVEQGMSLAVAKSAWSIAARARAERDAARAEANTAKQSLLALGEGAPPVATGKRGADSGKPISALTNGRTAEQMLEDPTCRKAWSQLQGGKPFDEKNAAERAAFLGYVRDEIKAGREPFGEPE